jgi:dTDP-4-dehydrorhamnose 3,5-epimerase
MIMEQGRKDVQSVEPGGRLRLRLPEGVELHEMPNIVTGNGITAEVYRPDWGLTPKEVRHIIHVRLNAFAITAWHRHLQQTDRIFVTDGSVRLVMFDGREGATKGLVTELRLSRFRPTLVVVPPGIWHGLQNMTGQECGFINFFDRPYQYEDPDEWRLPLDTSEIPYRFPRLV